MIYKILKKIKDLILYLYSIYHHKNIDYFNYTKLSTFKKVYIGIYTTNMCYGNAIAIRKLQEPKFCPFRDFLEHGIVFSNALQSIEHININHIRNIYTFSDRRKKIIEDYIQSQGFNNKVFAVGPYILGAKNFYPSNKLLEIKKNYGKILLCFPVHSIDTVKNTFNNQEFISKIEEIRRYFDSIFICIHILDVNSPIINEYIKMGYTVVSNGFPDDPSFLSRQKDLIELSNMTLSNAIGTHIGYSIALNRPFYFIKQNINTICTEKKQSEYETIENKTKKELTSKVNILFGTYSLKITKEQQNFVKEYWGEF